MRAIVRVTSTAGRAAVERDLLSQIDVHGPMAANAGGGASTPIVVEATVDGLPPARVTIATSTDPADGVMAVAQAGAGKPVDFFGH